MNLLLRWDARRDRTVAIMFRLKVGLRRENLVLIGWENSQNESMKQRSTTTFPVGQRRRALLSLWA
jgi:hypothetical protein